MQVVAETLKMLVVALNISPALADTAPAAVLAVLIPLLIAAAAPETPPVPALADMAVKLVTHLASGPQAPAFRVAVAQLPAGAKVRLQTALRASAAGPAAAVPGGRGPAAAAGDASPAGRKPGIALKNFAFAS